MNPNTATNEELRDWLAIKQGWKRDPHSGMWVSESPDGIVMRLSWTDIHPIPNTIDAAAKCLPDGGVLTLDREQWEFRFETEKFYGFVYTARTTDEATDRFRLAVKAIMAMEECK